MNATGASDAAISPDPGKCGKSRFNAPPNKICNEQLHAMLLDALNRIAELERRTAPKRKRVSDLPADSNLCAELAARSGGIEFLVSEVSEHAATRGGEPLRDALIAAGAGNAKRLGRWLRRMSVAGVPGYSITRLGDGPGVAIWLVRAVTLP